MIRKQIQVLLSLAILTLGSAVPSLVAQTNNFKVISYIRTWTLGSTNEEFDQGKRWSADQIRGDLLTSLDVAFATITNKTDITFADMADAPGKADPTKTVPGFKSLPEELAKLAVKYPNLVRNVSIGGWGAEGFPAATATEADRKSFASHIAAFVQRNHFSGVDIDWEYPDGSVQGTAYVQMMTEIRAALDTLQKTTGIRYNLTAAVPSSGAFLNDVDLHKLAAVADYLKVMTYDYFGSWTDTTGHASGLFANPADPSPFGDEDAVNNYLDAKIPPQKLILGIPFYGRAWDGVPKGPIKKTPGLYQPHGDSLWEDGLDYASIKAKIGQDGFVRYWDDTAKVPFLYNGKIFITYDDPESIALKVKFAKDKGLAGVMVWEYAQDMDAELFTVLKKAVDAP